MKNAPIFFCISSGSDVVNQYRGNKRVGKKTLSNFERATPSKVSVQINAATNTVVRLGGRKHAEYPLSWFDDFDLAEMMELLRLRPIAAHRKLCSHQFRKLTFQTSPLDRETCERHRAELLEIELKWDGLGHLLPGLLELRRDRLDNARRSAAN